MALIGEIRKRSWILIVLIGLAMGGFLLMDMFSRMGVGGLMNPNTIGSVNGEKINAQEFFAREQALFQSSENSFGNKDALWNLYIQEILLDKMAKKLGIDVSEEEKTELYSLGPNLSPIILQNFQYNTELYGQYKQAADAGQLNEQQQADWDRMGESIILNRKETKMNNLISKAIYTPTWMADMDNAEKTTGLNFKFVGIPFSTITEEIKVTDSDISKYIKKYGYRYKNTEETRKGSYVSFDVIASAKDSANIKAELVSEIAEYKATKDDDEVFIADHYGTYSKAYVKKATLNPSIADTLFNLPIGSIVGPYVDGRQFKAAKIIDRKSIPDSVQVRHILIGVQQASGNFAGMERANEIADSLKNLIQTKGMTFDSLVVANTNDPDTKDKGGDLGLNNKFPFGEDFDNAVMFDVAPNTLTKVESDYGVHLLEVTSTKSSGATGVKVGYLAKDIVPSEETIKAARAKAYDYVAKTRTIEQMKKSANEKTKISVASTGALTNTDHNVTGLGSDDASREVVKWMYKAKVGEVSDIIYTFYDKELAYDSKFVIVGLASKQPKGLPSAKDMREELEPLVLNEKKGEMIVKKIKEGDNVDAIASQFSSAVQEPTNITFSQSFIPGLGNEPEVLGLLYGMEAGKTSKPIIGNSGVFVAQLVSKTEPQPIADYAAVKQQISSEMQGAVNQTIFEAMKKNAKIKDNRSRFY
jgi:peptidyl-prolyl cis-trans isomerase D